MSTHFLTVFPCGHDPVGRMPIVAGRRGKRTPELGRLLRIYREKLGKRSSLDIVVARLADLGLEITDKSVVSKYENGRPPHVGLLRGLAEIYGADFCALCQMMADELNGQPIVTRPEEPLSSEAVAVARAFDGPDEAFRALIRSAMGVHDSRRRPAPPAPGDDREQSGASSAERRRRRR